MILESNILPEKEKTLFSVIVVIYFVVIILLLYIILAFREEAAGSRYNSLMGRLLVCGPRHSWAELFCCVFPGNPSTIARRTDIPYTGDV